MWDVLIFRYFICSYFICYEWYHERSFHLLLLDTFPVIFYQVEFLSMIMYFLTSFVQHVMMCSPLSINDMFQNPCILSILLNALILKWILLYDSMNVVLHDLAASHGCTTRSSVAVVFVVVVYFSILLVCKLYVDTRSSLLL